MKNRMPQNQQTEIRARLAILTAAKSGQNTERAAAARGIEAGILWTLATLGYSNELVSKLTNDPLAEFETSTEPA